MRDLIIYAEQGLNIFIPGQGMRDLIIYAEQGLNIFIPGQGMRDLIIYAEQGLNIMSLQTLKSENLKICKCSEKRCPPTC